MKHRRVNVNQGKTEFFTNPAGTNPPPTRITPALHLALRSLPKPPGHEDTTPPATQRHQGFRGDYFLGDPLRSPSHMVVEPSPDRAMRAASSLHKHDFAFVRRAGGGFTYAILAFRGEEDDASRGGDRRRRALTFVVSRCGRTETVSEGSWGDGVRLVRDPTAAADDGGGGRRRDDARRASAVAVVGGAAASPGPPRRGRGADEGHARRAPPRRIACFRGTPRDDECSVLSSVSERAEARERGRAW